MHTPSQKRQMEDFPIVVIGASTGGPPIVEQIVTTLPKTTRACILIAQHMPKNFTAQMSERLARNTAIPLAEAHDGDRLQSGMIFIAPGNHCMEIVRNRNHEPVIRITDECKTGREATPSIDDLMRSTAKLFGSHVTGFLLTGMGRDGTLGMQFIRNLGGTTYAQEPSTCIVDSMVQYAIGCDAIDHTVLPGSISSIISRLT